MAKRKVNTPKIEASQNSVALKAAEQGTQKATRATAIRIGQIGEYRPIPQFKGCRNC